MKKEFFLLCFFIFIATTGSFGQDGYVSVNYIIDDYPLSRLNDVENESQWSWVNLNFNPAGFLLLGPMAQVEFRVGKKTYTGLYYINHYLGLFAGEIFFDNTISSFSPKSMGGGMSIRHYLKPNAKLNAWYIGFYAGYSYNEATYHKGDFVNEKVEKVDNVPLFASGGYRWNLGKHFFLNAGLQLGVSLAVNDKIYWVYQYNSGLGEYEEKLTEYDDYSGEVYPFISPELSFGIKF